MMFEAVKTTAPIITPRTESEASHFLTQHSDQESENPIGEVEVKPGEQSHMSLGSFYRAKPPKGFSIYISPEPNAVITQITSLESSKEVYELVLHIANYGNQTVSAEVWQL